MMRMRTWSEGEAARIPSVGCGGLNERGLWDDFDTECAFPESSTVT
jgi:hypothetical protein